MESPFGTLGIPSRARFVVESLGNTLQIHWITPWILFFINPSINDLDISLQVHGMTKSTSFELTFWSVADTTPRARLFTGLDSENQGRTSIHLGSL